MTNSIFSIFLRRLAAAPYCLIPYSHMVWMAQGTYRFQRFTPICFWGCKQGPITGRALSTQPIASSNSAFYALELAYRRVALASISLHPYLQFS
jgi:hypothetical protein